MGKTSDASIKVTYSLPQELIDDVRRVVREGAAPSYSAFVEDALREAVRREREKLIAEEFEQAAEDPHFIADIDEVEKDFENADAESTKLIP
jgi:Arc/MetJ-type ribon-helix-helix transcriptional regulator